MKIYSRYVFSLAALTALPVAAQDASWNRTLERISSAVVSIRVDSTRSFDTERNQSTQATGFVVDAEQGLILTNRHVVTPGPVRAQAIFLNQEEVDLIPVYRDPVHDFGFFRYEPSDLQFIRPPELSLVPEAAQIGGDIRVVGNDAGEQLSILAGTIARLYRQAPNYGRGSYNDFNTFYLQAASGTSGGSSGSPVIDVEGRVVALNAGANAQAASSFFLPLERVRVALAAVRNHEPVERGTLQTEFVQKPYAELRRIGLNRDTEARMRAAYPEQTGLLVVEQVIPGSPASGLLRPGDILVEMEGRSIAEFVTLAALMDGNVGKEVTLAVERGGERLEYEITIGDLHRITPREYVEYGDGIFHDLSYQQARHFYRPVSGVYVANPGYVFGTAAIPRASLIIEIDRTPVDNLEDFQAALERLPEGSQVSVRFVTFDDPRNEKQRIIVNQRHWFGAFRCRRDDVSGVWPCEELADPPPAEARAEEPGTTFPREGERYVQQIAPSLALINFSMPYTVSGISDRYYYGTGLVVDAERGWIVVDRNTVPVAMGDVSITFAGSLEIPGRVEYIHPLHNLAVVSYDPAMIGSTPVRAARFVNDELKSGRDVWVVGLGPDHKLNSQSSEVADISPVNFPRSRTLRFRETNLEAIGLVNGPTDFDGVVVDSQGRVAATWSSFAFQTGRELNQLNLGLPSGLIVDMIENLKAGRELRSLEVEWDLMPVSAARKLSVPETWASRYEEFNNRRQLLAVANTVAGSPAEGFFRSGDILLSVDGQLVNAFRALERATQKPEVEIVVFRDGREVSERVATRELNGFGIDRAMVWAGALLQAPHRELAAQGVAPVGVYVAYFNFGSPASRSGLYAGRRVVAVNGRPTPDLDSFAAVVGEIEDDVSVRLNTLSLNNVPDVITLNPDTLYWPSYELHRVGYDWQRRPLN